MNDNGDFKVVGIDLDGGLLCLDLNTNTKYNCGDTLEQFGVENLSEEEKTLLTSQGVVLE